MFWLKCGKFVMRHGVDLTLVLSSSDETVHVAAFMLPVLRFKGLLLLPAFVTPDRSSASFPSTCAVWFSHAPTGWFRMMDFKPKISAVPLPCKVKFH